MPHKRRKIVLVIVEGPSDETALEQSFTALFDPDETKNKNAFRFATKYKDDFDGFVEYISGPTLAVAGDYKETWEYIRQDLNSLRRHTNLNLCFQKR